MGTYYINNKGSRWVKRPNERFALYREGKFIGTRLPQFYSCFGNIVSVYYSWKGRRHVALFHNDGSQHEGMAIVDVERSYPR